MTTEFNTSEHGLAQKRKRNSEEMDEHFSDGLRQLKRTNLNQLPIRTSPFLNQEHLWQSSISGFQQPLTPVDSSDEENNGKGRLWARRRTSPSPVRRLHLYSPPMLTVDDDAMIGEDDVIMDSESHSATTSNISMPQPPNRYLSAPAVSLDERAPTPIRVNFKKLDNTARGHHSYSTRLGMLSPVIAEDSYLPSPVGSCGVDVNTDPETMIRMEHASSGFGALTVACRDDEMMEDVITQEDPMKTKNTKAVRGSNGRNARLHMGYRADCEKCQQRVPGHYSHITWD